MLLNVFFGVLKLKELKELDRLSFHQFRSDFPFCCKSETYSEPTRTTKMKLLTKILKG